MRESKTIFLDSLGFRYEMGGGGEIVGMEEWRFYLLSLRAVAQVVCYDLCKCVYWEGVRVIF